MMPKRHNDQRGFFCSLLGVALFCTICECALATIPIDAEVTPQDPTGSKTRMIDTIQPFPYAVNTVLLVEGKSAMHTLKDTEKKLAGSRFEAILLRTGMTPETLTAAGLDSTEVKMVIADASDYLLEQAAVLYRSDSSCERDQQECDRLSRLLHRGVGTTEDLSNYRIALQNLTTARADQSAELDRIFAAATANISEQKRTLLQTIRGNWHLLEDQPVTVEFMATPRNDADWIALSDALENETFCSESGETIDPEVQTTLTSKRNESSVNTARTNLNANLATNTIAWKTAVNE